MPVSERFMNKLNEASVSREKLIQLLAELDEEKRSVRSSLSQLSSEPTTASLKGRERQAAIRRMKDKISFLTEEREAVRQRLGQIKEERKATNRRSPARNAVFTNAFVAAAESILSEQKFLEIELKAAQIIESTQ